MTNPYIILGVAENATDEEIKKAYRRLSRKYHPDTNVNNPNREQAEERFKEVQQAYQEILKLRSRKTGYGSYSGSNEGYHENSYGDFHRERRSSSSQDNTEKYLQAALEFIEAGYYSQAIHILLMMENRTARWYYLSARANMGVGNNLIALEHAEMAVRMEMGNMEYRKFYEYLQTGPTWYAEKSTPYGGKHFDLGDGACLGCCMIGNILCRCCCGRGFCYI